MHPNSSAFHDRDIAWAIGAVLNERVFYFDEEDLLLEALFGCDGYGGFCSPETNTHALEQVALVVAEIFPHHPKEQRARFLNALIGEEGMGGILHHIDRTQSDPFAQWGAMRAIYRLLKSEDPNAQERKRMVDALKSIDSERRFLKEDCMARVRPYILATAATCIELLGREDWGPKDKAP